MESLPKYAFLQMTLPCISQSRGGGGRQLSTSKGPRLAINVGGEVGYAVQSLKMPSGTGDRFQKPHQIRIHSPRPGVGNCHLC